MIGVGIVTDHILLAVDLEGVPTLLVYPLSVVVQEALKLKQSGILGGYPSRPDYQHDMRVEDCLHFALPGCPQGRAYVHVRAYAPTCLEAPPNAWTISVHWLVRRSVAVQSSQRKELQSYHFRFIPPAIGRELGSHGELVLKSVAPVHRQYQSTLHSSLSRSGRMITYASSTGSLNTVALYHGSWWHSNLTDPNQHRLRAVLLDYYTNTYIALRRCSEKEEDETTPDPDGLTEDDLLIPRISQVVISSFD